MKDEYLKRTKGLLGEENYNSYKTKRIAYHTLSVAFSPPKRFLSL